MYLKLAYLGLSALMILVNIIIGSRAINKTFDAKKVKSKIIYLIAVLLLWQLYIFILSLTGLLNNFDFPPRFFVFIIVPAFICTGVFIYKNKNNQWIKNIPVHWLIFYQLFRVLIEIIFVFSVAAGILHPNVTIEGYNFDMIFSFTSLIIGCLLLINRSKYQKLTIAWNYLGLIVIANIIFLFQATIYFPEMFGPDTKPFPIEFVEYPYILVAGFLMPSAVFIHILSIVQLKMNKQ